MGAFADFIGGFTEAAGVKPAGSGTDSMASTATTAGAGFFSLLRQYTQSGSVKAAIEKRLSESRTVQAYASDIKSQEIQKFLSNPLVWIGGLVFVLIVGGIGYAVAKR